MSAELLEMVVALEQRLVNISNSYNLDFFLTVIEFYDGSTMKIEIILN